jgi:hypothetical protein
MPHTPSRRDFLRTTTAAAAAGLALAGSARATAAAGFGRAKSCIFINMVGGPAHLDTFDPKPDAPSDVRGPFAPIQTNVPGVRVSELFPKLAAHADKFALVRSMHHDAPPVHECGFQLLNTGRLFRDGPEWPSAGAVVAHLTGRPSSIRAHALELNTGIAVSHGQDSAWLKHLGGGVIDSTASFGDMLAEVVEAPVAPVWYCSHITINQFSTVFDAPSWDCHADGGSLRTTLNDVRDTVAPRFDTAVSALLAQLDERGLLESTLVVATGEFGRTPKLNSNGGRDHWAGCWSALVAGGGTKGGRIVGASDRTGSEPAARPVSPPELVASVFHALGIARDATIPGPDGAPVRVYPADPVSELF